MYAGKSAKSGKEKWGDLEEELLPKEDDKGPKDDDEDSGITTQAHANIRLCCA
jgi:hypothetical protein